MLPLLVASLVGVAWLPTNDTTHTRLPSWADDYSRFVLSPRFLRLLWIFWHVHAIYALARQDTLTPDVVAHVLFAWGALKFWSSSFFSESMLLMAYLVSTVWLLAAAVLQARAAARATVSTAQDAFLDTVAASTLAGFAVWNFDVLQRILRRQKRRPVARVAVPGRGAQDAKGTSRRQRTRDKRWQPAGASKR